MIFAFPELQALNSSFSVVASELIENIPPNYSFYNWFGINRLPSND